MNIWWWRVKRYLPGLVFSIRQVGLRREMRARWFLNPWRKRLHRLMICPVRGHRFEGLDSCRDCLVRR